MTDQQDAMLVAVSGYSKLLNQAIDERDAARGKLMTLRWVASMIALAELVACWSLLRKENLSLAVAVSFAVCYGHGLTWKWLRS